MEVIMEKYFLILIIDSIDNAVKLATELRILKDVSFVVVSENKSDCYYQIGAILMDGFGYKLEVCCNGFNPEIKGVLKEYKSSLLMAYCTKTDVVFNADSIDFIDED